MKTNETDTTIAVQPESELEQALVAELYEKLVRQSDAPSHPDKVGSRLVYFTLDVDEYDDLNHDLWEEVECGVNENGQLAPEPGSRALVIVHDAQAQEEKVSESATDEAVEQLKNGSDEDNEYTVSLGEAFENAREVLMMDDPDYSDDIQEAAKMASTVGYDIPANQAGEDIISDLQDFIEATKEEVEIEE